MPSAGNIAQGIADNRHKSPQGCSRMGITLLNHDLLHLSKPLHGVIRNTLPKHEEAEAPLQVIVSELVALLSLHFKVTDWNRVHASSLFGFCRLFPCLLPISCNRELSSRERPHGCSVNMLQQQVATTLQSCGCSFQQSKPVGHLCCMGR